MGARQGKAKGKEKKAEVQFGRIKQIKWVRLVRAREQTVGIGFLGNRLIHYSVSSSRLKPRAPRLITVKHSILILHDLAEIELKENPDVECNSIAWLRWLQIVWRNQ